MIELLEIIYGTCVGISFILMICYFININNINNRHTFILMIFVSLFLSILPIINILAIYINLKINIKKSFK